MKSKDMDKKMYTMQDVSKMFNISVSALRYYTDCGLVPTVCRGKNNNRLFDEKSLDWVQGIVCLRGCGMSINNLKKYVELCLKGESTTKERYFMILEQREQVLQEAEEIKARMEYINKKIEIYEDCLNGEKKDILNPSGWEVGKYRVV